MMDAIMQMSNLKKIISGLSTAKLIFRDSSAEFEGGNHDFAEGVVTPFV